MRRILAIILVISAMCGAIRAQGPPQTPAPRDERVVDFTADVMRPIQVGDSTVLNLLGNVVLYHNGAVITCDSAVRHSSKRMECFYNVLLNKDSTYIYGDRLDYNGEINLARVYSPLVKMVDGDAVLYTRNLTFNTLDKIGRYFGGGTMRQGDNLLESYRGYYYADARDFICVDSVQASSPEYRLMSDSATYNLDQQVATFFTRSYIWNEKNEILSATKGQYFHKTADYRFTADSYLLSEKQEVWSDTLDYNSNTRNAVLRRDIQIRDEEQKVMAFGDYGQYWGEREDGLLTIDPSLVTFDPKEDSLYMRADSMFLFSIGYDLDFAKYEDEKRIKEGRLSLSDAQQLHNDAIGAAGDSTVLVSDLPRGGAVADTASRRAGAWGSAGEISDLQKTMIADKAALYATGDTLTRAMLTSEVYEWMIRSRLSAEDIEGQLLYNEYKARTGQVPDKAAMAGILKQAGILKTVLPDADSGTSRKIETLENERPIVPDSLGKTATSEAVAGAPAVPENEKTGEAEANSQEIEDILSEKTLMTVPGPIPEAEPIRPDSISAAPAIPDSLSKSTASALYVVPRDSLGMPVIPVDSLGVPLFAVDSLGTPILMRDSLGAPVIPLDSLGKPFFTVNDEGKATVLPVIEPQRDSLQRIVRAYRNVRIYRNDFQAVCDSLIGFTKDSTMHMYIDPVMWNGENQITSEIIDIFTKNEELQRAFFTGQPMMVSKVDSINYNQVRGRTMEAFFRENNIFRHDVVGNAESYYYMMDDEAQEANAFLEVRCGNISFFIEEKLLDNMVFRENITWTMYPIDNIPTGVERFLPGFKWQEERRPDLAGVFSRTIRPTEREFYENLPQPRFPKTERIESDKARMIQNGQWTDRNDTLPPHALEFIHGVENR